MMGAFIDSATDRCAPGNGGGAASEVLVLTCTLAVAFFVAVSSAVNPDHSPHGRALGPPSPPPPAVTILGRLTLRLRG